MHRGEFDHSCCKKDTQCCTSFHAAATEQAECVAQGDYGPFQPNFPVEVPLWLAIMLNKRKKCRIEAPDWLQSDHLTGSMASMNVAIACSAKHGLATFQSLGDVWPSSHILLACFAVCRFVGSGEIDSSCISAAALPLSGDLTYTAEGRKRHVCT